MIKKQKTNTFKVRKVGLAIKVLVPCIAIIIAIVGIMGSVSYYQMKNELETVAVEEAQVIAELTAKMIDTQQLSQLKKGDDNTDTYKILVEELKSIKKKLQHCISIYSL